MSKHYYERERSRDRHHGYRGRSESSDSYDAKKKEHHHKSSYKMPQAKRVKFAENLDIKVFKKEDGPCDKGLTDVELQEYKKKIEAERGSNSYSNLNWDNMKHIDAQLENTSIKEQKERERILNEKLLSIKQEMQYYSPLPLKNQSNLQSGSSSIEREALTARLNDVLGCFYVQQTQIPAEPTFQIQNKSTSSQPKNISFDKQIIDNNKDLGIARKAENKDPKPLKGILKMTAEDKKRERTESEPRKIDPKLITLLQQINLNKALYPKERTQILLRPYKESGELDYLKNNPTIFNALLRSSSVPVEVAKQPPTQASSSFSNIPTHLNSRPIEPMPNTGYYRNSPSPMNQPYIPAQTYPHNSGVDAYGQKYYNQYNSNQNPRFPQYPNQGQIYGNYPPVNPQHNFNQYQGPPSQQFQPPYGQQPNIQQQTGNSQQGQSMYNMMPMVNRNYKTVPCKYFHSPQGCVKANNCTFIHEQEYAGRATPSMMKSNRGMVMTAYNSESQGSGQNSYFPTPNQYPPNNMREHP